MKEAWTLEVILSVNLKVVVHAPRNFLQTPGNYDLWLIEAKISKNKKISPLKNLVNF